MANEGPRWQELALGGLIVTAGNAVSYQTGGWRSLRPVINWEKSATAKACTRCLVCWLYCPETSMVVRDGEFQGVDLDHCKGCGICAEVCPVSCITMVEEGRFDTAGNEEVAR